MIYGISIVVLDWLIKFIYVTLMIPSALLLLRYRRLNKPYKWVLSILLWNLVITTSSQILYQNNINPNYAGSVFYTLAVFLYLGFFFSSMNWDRIRAPFFAIAIVHVIFGACNILFIQKETLNTYTAISYSIIVISLCLLFYYQLLKNLPTENLISLPVFWFTTAEFVVNTGQMLMKSFAHFLINIFNDNLIVLWVFHHGLGIAGNLLITYACWLVFVKLRHSSHQSSDVI